MRKKIILILSIILLLSLSVVFVGCNNNSSGEKYCDFILNADGETYTATLKADVKAPKELKIPSLYNGKAVTSVDNFDSCDYIKSVVIPEGITKIEHGAFSFCNNLTSVTLPSTITFIGSNAFGLCAKLKNIQIPNGVTEIGDGAFIGCVSLDEIVIPSSVQKMGAGIFVQCDKIKIKVDIKESEKPTKWNEYWNLKENVINEETNKEEKVLHEVVWKD